MTGFAILRPHKAGLVTALEVERMKAIAPHLQRAFMIRNCLNESQLQVDAIGIRDRGSGFGVVIATATGWISYANCAAENLLRDGPRLAVRAGPHHRDGFPDRAKIAGADHGRIARDGRCAAGRVAPCPDEAGTASLASTSSLSLRGSSTILLARNNLSPGIFIVDRNSGTNDRAKKFASLFRVDSGRNARARRSDLGRRDREGFRTLKDYRAHGAHPSQTH